MQSRDLIAGISIAGLMLPEAIGYAGIAGLAPQHALLAACIGTCAYLVLGRSRFAIVTPTSSSAAILAAALGALPLPGDERVVTATLVVGAVGLMFCAMSAARLGGLAGFISRPVLRGFAFGLAITIIVKQLPIIVGSPLHGGNIGFLILALVRNMTAWHIASIAVGILAFLALLLLKRFPLVPGPFLVLAGGIAASMLFDLPALGVANVGMIDLIPHWEGFAWPSDHMLLSLPRLALPIVLILFAESWGTMRTLALRHGDVVEPNRELGALGISNIASALVMGMPVGAGFSAGSAAEAAGAQSRWTAFIAALSLAALVLLAMPLVAHLPEPVLAAVVIAALSHALSLTPLLRLWRIRRDVAVAMGAAIGVLVLGVLDGMLFAIALSLALLIRRLATPHVSQLGQLGAGHDYVDIAYHPEACVPAGIGIFRPAEPLFFANAERVLAKIAALQAKAPDQRKIILSLEESFDLDSTALDAVGEFDALMRQRNVTLQLARVRDHVRDLMRQAGAYDLLARSSYSVDDAVQALTHDREKA
ncbi:MAG: SulP family inorganic anion transporter [Sphingobium sp.]|nr:SulP family inorganic anion transporter [Sphingobium sp.]